MEVIIKSLKIMRHRCKHSPMRARTHTHTHTHTHTNKGNVILFSINISLPLITIPGMEGVDHWLGLPGHQPSHQWTSSYGATLKPWFAHSQLILLTVLLAVLLRQQQPPGSNLAVYSTHVSLCCTIVGHVSRSVAVWEHPHGLWLPCLTAALSMLFTTNSPFQAPSNQQSFSWPHHPLCWLANSREADQEEHE
jgi:hypothetical protein